jgi:hypothetical protein
MKANKTTRRQEVSNPRRRKDKESESSIDLTAHSQIPKQQTGIITHLLILTPNVNGLNSPSKDTIWQTGLKRKI